MESLAVLPLTQPSFFLSKPINRNTSFPSWPYKQRSSNSTRLNCQKMYVPVTQILNDDESFFARFGEASPEAKASKNLHNFFNYIAVKIVSTQLQSYKHNKKLMEFLNTHSLSDGDEFCASLMRESSRQKSLEFPFGTTSTLTALRILEVRSAYCKHDFEWDNLKRLAFNMMDESNTKLMREYVLETSPATEKETGK